MGRPPGARTKRPPDPAAFLFAEGPSAQPRAGLDAALLEPALVHLQHVAHRLGRAVRVGGLRLHVGQVDDGAVVGHEGGGQRQQGVLHPEALGGGLLEHEQHAFVHRHLAAVHQADLALLRRGRHLGVDAVHAGRQRHARQAELRFSVVLGMGQRQQEGQPGGQQQGAQQAQESGGQHGADRSVGGCAGDTRCQGRYSLWG